MKSLRLPAAALAACLAASGIDAKPHGKAAKSLPEQAAQVPVGNPNGEWALETSTSVGDCPGLIPPVMQIAENKIVGAPGGGIASWGYVDEEGTIVARFTAGGASGQGERVARFHGTLRGGKGSGAWSSSTDYCGGTWRATRSGAAVAGPAQETPPPQ